MGSAFSNHFTALDIIVPCCEEKTSLNELKYEWPAGFARFSIEILSPGKDLDDEELLSLESILSTKLKKSGHISRFEY